jgi:hypothetical protein
MKQGDETPTPTPTPTPDLLHSRKRVQQWPPVEPLCDEHTKLEGEEGRGMRASADMGS